MTGLVMRAHDAIKRLDSDDLRPLLKEMADALKLICQHRMSACVECIEIKKHPEKYVRFDGHDSEECIHCGKRIDICCGPWRYVDLEDGLKVHGRCYNRFVKASQAALESKSKERKQL